MGHMLDELRDPALVAVPASQRMRLIWRQARAEYPDDPDAQVARYRELLEVPPSR